MAHALLRSAGNLQRLAQASVASSVLSSDWAQPAGITSLLAWHQRSTTDHRKLFSSEDKRDSSQPGTQAHAEASKQPGHQQAGLGSASGTVKKTVLQDGPDLLKFFTEPYNSLRGRAAVWTVRNRVETTFDEAEFLEGAKDAWVAVNSCMNDRDVDKLQEMCTPGMVTAFREVFAEQAEQNQFFEVQELDVKDAQVAGASFLLPETPPVAAGSEGTAAATPPGAPTQAHWAQWAMDAAKDALAGSSLALWVKFSGCMNKSVVKDKTGKVTQELEDRRSSHWLFVRGPLPSKLPVRELDVPWQLMGFQ